MWSVADKRPLSRAALAQAADKRIASPPVRVYAATYVDEKLFFLPGTLCPASGHGGLVSVLLGSSQASFCRSPAGRRMPGCPAPVYSGQRSAETADRPVAGKSIGMSDAVEHALRFNPGLGAQEAESRSSEEGRKSARGAFGPRLGVSYSATKTESKRDPSATMGTKNPKMGVYSWGIEVTQPHLPGLPPALHLPEGRPAGRQRQGFIAQGRAGHDRAGADGVPGIPESRREHPQHARQPGPACASSCASPRPISKWA